jgi:sugar/nucleoside kinase (ribokinase family)
VLDCGGQDAPISDNTLKHLSYISPNETELLRLDPTIEIGEHFSLEVAAEEIRKKLISKHPNLKVLLKLGSKGSAIITPELAVQGDVVTSLNPDVLKDFKIVDTVGAGDCFTGAFSVRHSELDWSDKKKWSENYR